MIGAQAYYRNCGFVHFIEEQKKRKEMKTYKLIFDVEGDGLDNIGNGTASIAFDAKSDSGAMREAKGILTTAAENGYSISRVRLVAIRKINIDPILLEEWK